MDIYALECPLPLYMICVVNITFENPSGHTKAPFYYFMSGYPPCGHLCYIPHLLMSLLRSKTKPHKDTKLERAAFKAGWSALSWSGRAQPIPTYNRWDNS